MFWDGRYSGNVLGRSPVRQCAGQVRPVRQCVGQVAVPCVRAQKFVLIVFDSLLCNGLCDFIWRNSTLLKYIISIYIL